MQNCLYISPSCTYYTAKYQQIIKSCPFTEAMQLQGKYTGYINIYHSKFSTMLVRILI